MTAFTFWTGADPKLITRVIGRSLRSFRPNVPEHRFVEWAEGKPPPEPGPGEVVIVCGDKALNELRLGGLVPKNRTLNSMRETPVKRGDGWYLVTYDPAATEVRPELAELIDWDIRLAHRLHKTGTLRPAIGDYQWVSSFAPMIAEIEAMYAKTGKPVKVAFDTETMGLYPWYKDKDLVCVSFTHKPGCARLLYLGPKEAPIPLDHSEPLYDQIKWLLTSPKVRTRMANGKYDCIWVKEKWDIDCTNFTFDTLLVGSLLDENRTNSLNLHAKLFTDFGGYDDCVSPETRLLTSDLRWVPAGDLKAGDELVGFDEHNGGVKGFRRKLRVAITESTKRLTKPGLKISLSNGTSITCSTDHGFLSQTGVNGGGTVWKRGYELKRGDKLKLGAPVEVRGETHDDGWMGGFLDGEGFCSKNHADKFGGFCFGWSQKVGPVHDRAVEIMKTVATSGYCSEKAVSGVLTTKFTQWPALRALMRFRPERLIAKRAWVGAAIPHEPEFVTITSMSRVGLIEVVSLQTTTHTFIAEGVCSHNSFNRVEDKGRMEAVPPAKLLPYAGGDTDACYQAAEVLQNELDEDPPLRQFYTTILHPAARAFEKVERRGILIDKEKYHKLAGELRVYIKERQDVLLGLLPAKMKIKYRDRIEEQIAKGKNPLLPSILHELFFTPHGFNLKPQLITEKSKQPSLTKPHLRAVAEGHPDAQTFIASMTEQDSAAKTLSTFVEGFLKHLRPDGRFHPSYMLFHGGYADDEDDEAGTVTGRLSAKEPAFQVTPKKTKWAKRIRECFIAPPGKVIVCIDYSQGELKVVACFAPEKTMIQAYLDGLDLHAVTGAKLAGVKLEEFIKWKDNEDKELAALFEKHRGNAKPANFGLLYGQMAAGFIAYAWANYGIQLTLAEGEKMRDAFFQLYPGLLDFHDRQRNLVGMHQMVRSPLGRIRHLPTIKSPDFKTRNRAQRQAINSPIQSTLADLMEWAIAIIDAEFSNEEVQVVGNIHDALVAYIDEDKVPAILPQVIEIMSNLPLHKVGWNPPLKFTVDAEVGLDLANVKKWKKAA